MSTTDVERSGRGRHTAPVEASAGACEATGAGPRIAEAGVVSFLSLLVASPLLVPRVGAHHQAHSSTPFLHRPWP